MLASERAFARPISAATIDMSLRQTRSLVYSLSTTMMLARSLARSVKRFPFGTAQARFWRRGGPMVPFRLASQQKAPCPPARLPASYVVGPAAGEDDRTKHSTIGGSESQRKSRSAVSHSLFINASIVPLALVRPACRLSDNSENFSKFDFSFSISLSRTDISQRSSPTIDVD